MSFSPLQSFSVERDTNSTTIVGNTLATIPNYTVIPPIQPSGSLIYSNGSLLCSNGLTWIIINPVTVPLDSMTAILGSNINVVNNDVVALTGLSPYPAGHISINMNYTTGIYTAPLTGSYTINASILWDNNNSSANSLVLIVDVAGSTTQVYNFSSSISVGSTTTYSLVGGISVYLQQGDQVSILGGNFTGATREMGSNSSFVSIVQIS